MANPIAATQTIDGNYTENIRKLLTGKRPIPSGGYVDPDKLREQYIKRLQTLNPNKK